MVTELDIYIKKNVYISLLIFIRKLYIYDTNNTSLNLQGISHLPALIEVLWWHMNYMAS